MDEAIGVEDEPTDATEPAVTEASEPETEHVEAQDAVAAQESRDDVPAAPTDETDTK